MLKERAQVVDVKGDKAWLAVQRQSTCQSCSVKKGCGTSVLSEVIGKKMAAIKVDNTLNAKVGDFVDISIEENALLSGSFLIYVLPLVSFFMAALIASYFTVSEGLVIFSSITSLVLMFLALKKLMRQSQLKSIFEAKMIALESPASPHFSVKLMS